MNAAFKGFQRLSSAWRCPPQVESDECIYATVSQRAQSSILLSASGWQAYAAGSRSRASCIIIATDADQADQGALTNTEAPNQAYGAC